MSSEPRAALAEPRAFVPAGLRPPGTPVPLPWPLTPQGEGRPTTGKDRRPSQVAVWQSLRTREAGRAAALPAPQPDPVAAARAEAERILAEARAEAERLRAAAESEGHAAGYQRGRADARIDLRRLTREAYKLAREARDLRAAMLAELSGDVAEAAVALAAAVLGRNAENGCEDLRALAVELTAEARPPLRLRVHPDDVPQLEGDSRLAGAEVKADPAVDRGGLILEAADGDREATLEGRLRRLAAALKAMGEQR